MMLDEPKLSDQTSRREFVRAASIALSLPLLFGCRSDMFAQGAVHDLRQGLLRNAITDPSCSWCGARDMPATVGPAALIAPKPEAGERIVIRGTVYGKDGKTPYANALIYAYHTDIHGIYGRGNEHKHGRFRGWMLTDANGQYSFETILPASYPNSTIAKHIHMTVTTVERKEDWIDSILFEGDRFITARERVITKGGFNPILSLAKDRNGVLSGVRDIMLT